MALPPYGQAAEDCPRRATGGKMIRAPRHSSTRPPHKAQSAARHFAWRGGTGHAARLCWVKENGRTRR